MEEEKTCEFCDGYGETTDMECYGGLPIERRELCLDCDGEGVVRIEKKLPQRIRDW